MIVYVQSEDDSPMVEELRRGCSDLQRVAFFA
jgi:hypothetical protein